MALHCASRSAVVRCSVWLMASRSCTETRISSCACCVLWAENDLHWTGVTILRMCVGGGKDVRGRGGEIKSNE